MGAFLSLLTRWAYIRTRRTVYNLAAHDRLRICLKIYTLGVDVLSLKGNGRSSFEDSFRGGSRRHRMCFGLRVACGRYRCDLCRRRPSQGALGALSWRGSGWTSLASGKLRPFRGVAAAERRRYSSLYEML